LPDGEHETCSLDIQRYIPLIKLNLEKRRRSAQIRAKSADLGRYRGNILELFSTQRSDNVWLNE
jgi:hypothetical protein